MLARYIAGPKEGLTLRFKDLNFEFKIKDLIKTKSGLMLQQWRRLD